MIIYSPLKFDEFYSICTTLTFKDKDEQEAKDILLSSSGSVLKLISNTLNKKYNKYYIILDPDKNKIVSISILNPCNLLTHFVTKNLDKKNTIIFIKTLKKLLKEELKYHKFIKVDTKLNYKEAIKFNKLIGFKLLSTNIGRNDSSWIITYKDIQ